jgi:hypothetical protein
VKKTLIIAVLLAFALAVTSAMAANEVTKGTVTKISGKQVTILDDAGKEMVLGANVPGLKVGDKVTVNQGKIMANPQLNPQPEPPRPTKQVGIKVDPKTIPGQANGHATPEQPTPPPKTTPSKL